MRFCDIVKDNAACRKPAIARVYGEVDPEVAGEPPDRWERGLCRDHMEHARIFAAALGVTWERLERIA